MKKVSIGIITFKRPKGLKRLLESLISQQVSDDIELDIIIVDNACEQEIEEVVAELQNESKYKLHYCQESISGIVSARNKCVEQFLSLNSDFLIFIDDDEWTETEYWVQKMVDAQQKYIADVVTSHVISVGEEGTPSWTTQLLYGDNKLVEGQPISVFYTNNLLISKQVLETVSPAFDLRFAQTGASDYHFSLKCNRKGFKAFYTEAPVIEEFPKSRATIQWFIKRGFRSGNGFTKSHMFEDSKAKAIPYCLLAAGSRLARGIFYMLLGTITVNKLKFVDGLFRLSSFMGSLAGFFGIDYQEYKTIHGK